METTAIDERTELLAMLREERGLLLVTVRGPTDAHAAHRSTASALTLGGLLRHLTVIEGYWCRILRGEQVPATELVGTDQHEMGQATLAELVADYRAAAARTDEAIAGLADLDTPVRLPDAPWFPEPQYWSPRHIVLHLLREISQHAGHADIIRETMDGANSTAQWATIAADPAA